MEPHLFPAWPRRGAPRRRGWGCALVLVVLILLAPAARADMAGHGGPVRAIAVSPDGARVLTGSFDYSARLWDFTDQGELAVLEGHTGPVNAVAFLPDGQRALTAGDDRTVLLWDLSGPTPKPLRTLTGHEHKIVALAVSPDGRTAATASWDRTARLWDLETGRQLQVLQHPSPVNAVVFARGGQLVVTGAHDGLVRAWRTADGLAQGDMAGHEMGITQLAVSADGRRVASASIDRTLRLWDLDDMTQALAVTHHESQVFAITFAPDGRTALSTDFDGFLVQWSLDAGKPVRIIQAHDRLAWALALTPDGRFALTAGSDGTVRVWHLETGDRIGPVAQADTEPQPWLDSTHPGARLYRKCAKCHSLRETGTNRSGPHFVNLFGRRAGSVDGYRYSRALRESGVVWTADTLRALFAQGPDAFLPGTKMPLQRITDPKQLEQLIDYMRGLTAGG
ncbi:MAG: c-type cytochrome [Rhodobacterales bacterium]|nr:c-type cytochrome [Rhodobacterales bacterium]